MIPLQESSRIPPSDNWKWGTILALSSVILFLFAFLFFAEIVTSMSVGQTVGLVAGIVVVLSAVAARFGYGLLSSLLVGVVPVLSHPVAHVYTRWGGKLTPSSTYSPTFSQRFGSPRPWQSPWLRSASSSVLVPDIEVNFAI